MNVYVSADIEGCTGVASFSQCGRADRAHPDFLFARKMMTADLNAVIQGVKRAGANRVVVKDGHGNCKNLLIDELEPGVELISGQGSTRDGMMDGIDGSFDCAMLFGYHAMAGATRGMMEHALVGGLYRFRINGRPAGEILTNSAVAGAYGVPTVFVEADEAGVQEAYDAIPSIETVCVKQGLGRFMGRMISPAASIPRLEEAAFRAVKRSREIAPVRIEGETRMEAEFRSAEEAEMAALLPGIQRLSSTMLSWGAPDFLSAHRMALDLFRLSMQGRKSGD